MGFICFNELPKDRTVSYSIFVCDNRLLKMEKIGVRITVERDQLKCPDNISLLTTPLIETKLQ